MAHEIELQTSGPVVSSGTVYAVIRNPAGLVWQATQFVTFVDADIGNYSLAMTQQGTASGYWVADFPTAITTPGTYHVVVYKRVGGSPAVSDTVLGHLDIDWDGSHVSTPATGDDLTTRAYVKAHLQLAVSTYDATIDQQITFASAAVTKYLGRSIKTNTYEEVRNGQGTDWIRVYNPPIQTVSQIYFDYDSDSPTQVTGDQFLWEETTGIIKFKPSSSQRRGFDERFQCLRVDYDAGYADVPADIQTAVAMIVGIAMFSWNNAYMGVTEQAVGDVKIKYADLFTSSGDLNLSHPVFGQAVALLRLYKITRY